MSKNRKPNINIFKIEIEETLQQVIFVEATNKEEAEKKVIDRYDMGDIVLDSANLTGSEIDVKYMEDSDLNILDDNDVIFIEEDCEEGKIEEDNSGGLRWTKE